MRLRLPTSHFLFLLVAHAATTTPSSPSFSDCKNFNMCCDHNICTENCDLRPDPSDCPANSFRPAPPLHIAIPICKDYFGYKCCREEDGDTCDSAEETETSEEPPPPEEAGTDSAQENGESATTENEEDQGVASELSPSISLMIVKPNESANSTICPNSMNCANVQGSPCNPKSAETQFEYIDNNEEPAIQAVNPKCGGRGAGAAAAASFCLSAFNPTGSNFAIGAGLRLQMCKNRPAQRFHYTTSGKFKLQDKNKPGMYACLGIMEGDPNQNLVLMDCNVSNPEWITWRVQPEPTHKLEDGPMPLLQLGLNATNMTEGIFDTTETISKSGQKGPQHFRRLLDTLDMGGDQRTRRRGRSLRKKRYQ